MNDLLVAMPISGQAVQETDILLWAVADLAKAHAARLEEVGLEPEDFDLVLLAVPKGRHGQIAENIVTRGFAHGDALAESPETT